MAKRPGAVYNPVMAARNALRRAFSRSPIIIEMMQVNKRKVPRYNKDGTRAKVDSVEHLCSVCKQWKRSSKTSKVAIDHIDPVIDPKVGFVDLNTYFARLWCDKSNLQKICGECHRQKTNAEAMRRRLKEDTALITTLEKSKDHKSIKKLVTRLKKKLSLYPVEFQERIRALQSSIPSRATRRR